MDLDLLLPSLRRNPRPLGVMRRSSTSQGFDLSTQHYVNPATNDDPRNDPNVSVEKAQAKMVMTVLTKHYPGQPWQVVADNVGKIVKIRLPVFMGPTNCWSISFDTLKQHDRAVATIKRFGGEILERYQVPRAGFSLDHYVGALGARPKHSLFHGHVPS